MLTYDSMNWAVQCSWLKKSSKYRIESVILWEKEARNKLLTTIKLKHKDNGHLLILSGTL